MSKTSIPFVDLSRQFRSEETDLVDIFKRVGSSGAYVMGNGVEQFEKARCGVKYALGVANGTDFLSR